MSSDTTKAAQVCVTARDIKKVKDVEIRWVDLSDVLGAGKGIYVKTITARARDAYEQSLFDRGSAATGKEPSISYDNARAKFVTCVACDKDGNLLFNPEDAEWLGEKSSSMVAKIFTESQRLNKMTEEDFKAEVKNSGATPTGDSSISS